MHFWGFGNTGGSVGGLGDCKGCALELFKKHWRCSCDFWLYESFLAPEFNHFKLYSDKEIPLKNVHSRCIVETSGFTRGVCKNRGFIKFKGILVEFLENRQS